MIEGYQNGREGRHFHNRNSIDAYLSRQKIWWIFLSRSSKLEGNSSRFYLKVQYFREVTYFTAIFYFLINIKLTFTKITNKMQLYRLIYYYKSALHVSGNVFAHHQEYLIVFTVSGSVHPSCCRLVSWMSWNWTMWVVRRLHSPWLV